MPYIVKQSNQCPADKAWGVFKESTGELVACHVTKAMAEEQMQALYANEKSAPVAGIERRTAPATELRVVMEGDAPKFDGYAAMFNADSQDLGGFIERIAPGAFADVLPTADTRALFNHNPDYVLGRTTAGTLALREDQRGLHMLNSPPDTQWARDLRVSVDRGDVSQMSFGFRVKSDTWEKRDGVIVRTINKVADLLDVSIVTYPAYPDTSVAARSLDRVLTEWKESETPTPVTFNRSLAERRLKLAMTL